MRRKETQDRRAMLAAVADRFEAFRPASEVFTAVRAVPTRFIQFDWATRVGGFPLERFCLEHGPSNEGKTQLALGFEESFLALDNYVLHVDAERTTPITWCQMLMGDLATHPGYFGIRPDSYEETMAKVRHFLNTVAELKVKKKIPADVSALVVCDSLRKLVPQDLMKEILKVEEEDAKNIKGGRDRGAQLKAKMNAAWMDELVPLLEHAGAAFLAIAREMEDPDADPWAKKFGNNKKVLGGSAIYYDASLVMRVDRASWISRGEGADKKVLGERHRITIRKTKIGGKDDKATIAYYHTSNGTQSPEGFDRPRDLFDLAVRFGLVKKDGSEYTYRGTRLGRGEDASVANLRCDMDLAKKVETEVRASFAANKPPEVSPDGEVT